MAQDKQHLTTEQLSDLLDGEVSAEEQAQWEIHLSTCPQCQQALEGLRQTVALLHMLPQPTLSRSFVLPIEATVPIAVPRALAAPIPIRPAQRRLNPYVRGVLRTVSTLVAVIGVVFLLSGLVVYGGGTSSTESSSAISTTSGSVAAAPSDKQTPEIAHNHLMPTQKTLTPAVTAMPTLPSVVQPQPSDTKDQPQHIPELPTTSFWPTIFIFNLSTAAGRLGLGMLLVILGIMGFVLFKRSGRENL